MDHKSETKGASVAGATRTFAVRQFLVFLLVGGSAATINWCSRYFLNFFMSYEAALAAAYVCGMAVAYYANSKWVFPNSSRPVPDQVFFFSLVNAVAFPLVWGTSWILSEIIFPRFPALQHPREVAHALALALPTVTSFFGHKFLTFRK